MTVTILRGDCRDVLKALPECSIQSCVTSPPYYGLRSYLPDGHPEKHLEIGLEPTPDEYVAEMVAVFREVRRVLREDGTLWLNVGDSYARDAVKGQHAPHQNGPKNTAHKAGVGRSVGIKRRMPKTHKHYGVHMSHCNQGDYEGVCCYGDDLECPALGGEHGDAKPKDLLGIPWMLAFALRADGWFLRSDIIWHKPNPMPESVRDRPTSAHEHVFLLTKAQRYFYDADAIRKPLAEASYSRLAQDVDGQAGSTRANGGAKTNGPMKAVKFGGNKGQGEHGSAARRASGNDWSPVDETANARNVWTIATQPYSGAHFATMPPDLAERCIKAGTSEKGCCPHCGAPWERVVDRVDQGWDGSRYGERAVAASGGAMSGGTARSTLGSSNGAFVGKSITRGWRPSCKCTSECLVCEGGGLGPVAYAPNAPGGLAETCCEACQGKGRVIPTPAPCTVLDPFGGAGTTGLVADRLNRSAVLIELNPDYRALAAARLRDDAPLLAQVR